MYDGNIVIEGENPLRNSGYIEITDSGIRFTNDNLSREISFSDAEISFGGTAKRIVYIKSRSTPGLIFHTSDQSILNDRRLDTHHSANSARKDRRRHKGLFAGGIVAAALLILLPLYFVFIERDMLAGFITSQIPKEIEVKLGDSLVGQQYKNHPDRITQAHITDDFNRLVAPLLDVTRHSGYDFEFYLIRSDQVNAMAAPGGHIIIFTGLIEQSETPEELLGVVAHEMAHVLERHSLKRMVSTLMGSVIFNIVASGTPDILYLAGDSGRFLLKQEYSRQNETEADEVGMDLLVQASGSPQGLITFFEKLKKKQSGLSKGALALLSTHPASQSRIENLKTKALSYNSNYKEIRFPYQEFKKNIAALPAKITGEN